MGRKAVTINRVYLLNGVHLEVPAFRTVWVVLSFPVHPHHVFLYRHTFDVLHFNVATTDAIISRMKKMIGES